MVFQLFFFNSGAYMSTLKLDNMVANAVLAKYLTIRIVDVATYVDIDSSDNIPRYLYRRFR